MVKASCLPASYREEFASQLCHLLANRDVGMYNFS